MLRGRRTNIDQDRRKRLEQIVKEDNDAAMRLTEFIFEDKAMKAMTPNRIREILDAAGDIITDTANGITLDQIRCILSQEANVECKTERKR